MPEAAEIAASGRQTKAGVFFTAGMNSFLDPLFVGERAFCVGYNTINRGGLVGCRPGFSRLPFCLPTGPIQGFAAFTPTGGKPNLVVAIAGKVYRTEAPFTSLTQLPLAFRAAAPMVYFCVATQSARRNSDGTISAIAPNRVLVMQDGGFSRAAFWDGAVARTLDPGPAALETPIGGPMVWSGDRLWVARGPQYFASDIANPLSYSENEYLSEGQSFLAPEDVTAFSEVPSASLNSQLLVFTANTTSIVRAGIRARDTWKSTPDFQRPMLTNVGCAAPRSIVKQYGLLWWYSRGGLVALDSELYSNSSTQISYRDTEMAVSKFNLAKEASQLIAGASFENFLLMSVPSGGMRNRHTWVLDQSTADSLSTDMPPAWAGIWTGIRPVEWAVATVNNAERLFCVSRDHDGVARIWEAFRGSPYDNGHPIEWSVEFGARSGVSPVELARFRYADIHLAQVSGDATVNVDYAGAYRGPWKNILSVELKADVGTYATADGGLVDTSNQSRVLRTKEVQPSGAVPTVEYGNLPEQIDTAHQLRVRGTGPFSVRAFRMSFDPEQEPSTGKCTASETVPLSIGANGARVTHV
jgi:hypothetical protein